MLFQCQLSKKPSNFFYSNAVCCDRLNLVELLKISPKKLRDHPFSTHAKISEKITFHTPHFLHKYTCYQGVRNVIFSEIFAYVLNG